MVINPRSNEKSITRVCQRLRETTYRVSELDAGRLKGEMKLDEAYFGRCRNGSEVVARREITQFLVSGSPRDVTTRERSNLFLPMNCRPRSAYREKIGHHHWRILQLSFLQKVWKTLHRSPRKKFPNTKNHVNRIEGFDPLLSMCHPTSISCQNIFSRSAFLGK